MSPAESAEPKAAASKRPSEWKYCALHAPDEMVEVVSKKCRTEGCSKQPSLGAADTRTLEYCTIRPGRDGRRVEQNILQNQNLQQACVVWGGRNEKGGVLFIAREERHDPPLWK